MDKGQRQSSSGVNVPLSWIEDFILKIFVHAERVFLVAKAGRKTVTRQEYAMMGLVNTAFVLMRNFNPSCTLLTRCSVIVKLLIDFPSYKESNSLQCFANATRISTQYSACILISKYSHLQPLSQVVFEYVVDQTEFTNLKMASKLYQMLTCLVTVISVNTDVKEMFTRSIENGIALLQDSWAIRKGWRALYECFMEYAFHNRVLCSPDLMQLDGPVERVK